LGRLGTAKGRLCPLSPNDPPTLLDAFLEGITKARSEIMSEMEDETD
jgi:hypothetical protein